MRLRQVLLPVLILVSAPACWHRAARLEDGTNREVITRAELDKSRDLTLYDAISRMRPSFLRNRSVTANGRGATQPIMVYFDGEKVDGIDDLRRIPPAFAEEVRYYEPQKANVVFGRYNNYGGAIAVISRLTGE